MALTGSTVASTYLDLVQLEKSGAGLPSHAGKEAALYDGSGAAIVGRTAQRHWQDPHPDAIATSYEFSTMGDMTKAELITAGWTFDNCDGAVTNGVLWLSNFENGTFVRAWTAVSFTGDFDVVAAPVVGASYGDEMANGSLGYLGVGTSTGDDLHFSGATASAAHYRSTTATGGAWASGGGTATTGDLYTGPPIVRISRVSGEIYCRGGSSVVSSLEEDEVATNGSAGWFGRTASEAQTLNRLSLHPHYGAQFSPTTGRCGFLFIRRFQ